MWGHPISTFAACLLVQDSVCAHVPLMKANAPSGLSRVDVPRDASFRVDLLIIPRSRKKKRKAHHLGQELPSPNKIADLW